MMRIQFLFLGFVMLILGAAAPAVAQRQPVTGPGPQIATPATPYTIRLPVEMAEVMVCQPQAGQPGTASCSMQQTHVCTTDEVYFQTAPNARRQICKISCAPQREASIDMFCACKLKQSDCR